MDVKTNGLIRQLKLHGLVGDKALADPRIILIHAFFDELFDGLQIEIIPEYHQKNIIFHKGGKFYMEHDPIWRWLECRQGGYWYYFESEVGLKYEETRSVIKYMVEKHLRQKVGTPGTAIRHHFVGVEKHLCVQMGTPVATLMQTNRQVEELLTQNSIK